MIKLRRRERRVKTKKTSYHQAIGICPAPQRSMGTESLANMAQPARCLSRLCFNDHVLFMFGSCLASPRVICNGSKVEDTTFSSTSSLTIPSHIIPNIFQRCPKMSKVWYQLVPLISVPRFAPMLELLPWNPDNSQNPATKSTVWLEANSKSSMQRKDSRFLDARLEVAAIDVHALSFWQTQHRRWWEGELLSCQSCMNLHFTISIGSFPVIMALRLYNRLEYKEVFHVPTDFIFNSKILKKKKLSFTPMVWPYFCWSAHLKWWCSSDLGAFSLIQKRHPSSIPHSMRLGLKGRAGLGPLRLTQSKGEVRRCQKKIKGIYNYIVLDFLDVYTINIHINVHHINTAGPIFWLSTVCQYVNPPPKKKHDYIDTIVVTSIRVTEVRTHQRAQSWVASYQPSCGHDSLSPWKWAMKNPAEKIPSH